MSCDSSLSSVCAEYYSMKVQLVSQGLVSDVAQGLVDDLKEIAARNQVMVSSSAALMPQRARASTQTVGDQTVIYDEKLKLGMELLEEENQMAYMVCRHGTVARLHKVGGCRIVRSRSFADVEYYPGPDLPNGACIPPGAP